MVPIHRLALYGGLVVWTLLVYVWATYWHMCHMESVLQPFLLNINREFTAAGIPLILDGGTLLGAMREKGIVATEMDLDLAVQDEDFERAMMLKSTLLGRYGYRLYGPRDYIFQKAYHRMYALEWEPYLNDFPCMRIYDENKWWYADVYCYKRIQRDALWVGLQKGLPPGFLEPGNANRGLVSLYPNSDERCAVLWEDFVFPTKQVELWGQSFTVPAKPEAVLETAYGPSWRIPHGKGVRILFCNKLSWFVILLAALALWALLAWKAYHTLPKQFRPQPGSLYTA